MSIRRTLLTIHIKPGIVILMDKANKWRKEFKTQTLASIGVIPVFHKTLSNLFIYHASTLSEEKKKNNNSTLFKSVVLEENKA